MSAIVLANDALAVTITPEVGGTVAAIRHRPSGLSVLGTVPWQVIGKPLDPPAAPDEPTWLTRYGGGWPLLFPNGGDACEFEGRFHGFHGEASVVPWKIVAQSPATLSLEHCFAVLPVRMRRDYEVAGAVLTIRETATLLDGEPVQVMWGHHPTFGSDLLAGDIEVTSGARSVLVDRGYDPPANPLLPGALGAWPIVPGKHGPFDLGHPMRGGTPMASLAFLRDFTRAWIGIRRCDDALAVALSWDVDLFPYAWFWCEFGGTREAPWHGQGRLLGLEPNATCSGAGIADAHARGENLVTLYPEKPVATWISLRVFTPSGPVTAADVT